MSDDFNCEFADVCEFTCLGDPASCPFCKGRYPAVKSDDELVFYMNCWREMQSFLAEVVRDNFQEYPGAADVLKLMKSIERKFEK